MGTIHKTTVVETAFYFVVQRPSLNSSDELSWTDISSKYWGTEGDDTAEVAALAERDRMRKIFDGANARTVRRDVLVTEHTVEDPEPAGEQELVEALRACVYALAKIDSANGALTEGCGDLLYDNPDPIAQAMNTATAHGQATYLKAARVLRGFEEGRS